MTPIITSKRRDATIHAHERARERYGVDLTDADIAAIGAMVREHHADAVPVRPDRDHESRTWFAVRWDGDWLMAVYDDAIGCVLSFLPACTLDPYRAGLDGGAAADEKPARHYRRALAPSVPVPTGFGAPGAAIGAILGRVDPAAVVGKPKPAPKPIPPPVIPATLGAAVRRREEVVALLTRARGRDAEILQAESAALKRAIKRTRHEWHASGGATDDTPIAPESEAAR